MRPDDYVVLAVSFKNLHDFFSNSGLREEVEKFEKYLEKSATPKEIISLLVDHDLLDGPFSFLEYWANSLEGVSIRVDRAGGLRIYRDRSNSIFGPMAIKRFPQPKKLTKD